MPDPTPEHSKLTLGGYSILCDLIDHADGPTGPPPDPAEHSEQDWQTLLALGYITPAESRPGQYDVTEAGRAAVAEFNEGMRTVKLQTSALAAALQKNTSAHWQKTLFTYFGTKTQHQLLSAINPTIADAAKTAAWANTLIDSSIRDSLRSTFASIIKSLDLPKIDLTGMHFGWGCLLRNPEQFSVPDFLADTGIPLAGSTPPSVSQALIDAGPEKAEACMLAHRAAITAQSRHALDINADEHGDWFNLARQTMDLLEDGHHAGAQALASCILTAIHDTFKREILDGKLLPVPDNLPEGVDIQELLRQFISRRTVHDKYAAHDPGFAERFERTAFRWAVTLPVLASALIPSHMASPDGSYSRNVTVHEGDPRHFTEANALRAVGTVVSLLWALHPTKAQELTVEATKER